MLFYGGAGELPVFVSSRCDGNSGRRDFPSDIL